MRLKPLAMSSTKLWSPWPACCKTLLKRHRRLFAQDQLLMHRKLLLKQIFMHLQLLSPSDPLTSRSVRIFARASSLISTLVLIACLRSSGSKLSKWHGCWASSTFPKNSCGKRYTPKSTSPSTDICSTTGMLGSTLGTEPSIRKPKPVKLKRSSVERRCRSLGVNPTMTSRRPVHGSVACRFLGSNRQGPAETSRSDPRRRLPSHT